jgi:CRISPR type II-A-associated protein Csn2
MRLVNTEYDITLMLAENQVDVLYVENPDCFAHMVRDLWMQHDGKEGAWILSSADKDLPIAKYTQVTVNPLAVDCNDRRILKVLYQDMAEDLQEKYLDEYTKINAYMVDFLGKIMSEQPYPLELNIELLPAELFKAYDVHFDMEYTGLCEQLASYIKIWHQVARVDVFVFVNLKSFLNREQYVALCEQAFYEKAQLLLLESHYQEQETYSFERIKIIDRDLCIIEI